VCILLSAANGVINDDDCMFFILSSHHSRLLFLFPKVRFVIFLINEYWIGLEELSDLDVSINVQKTCCLRIDPRHNATRATISTSFGIVIPWVDKVKYLGIIIERSHMFRRDLDHANKLFYRSTNVIFENTGLVWLCRK